MMYVVGGVDENEIMLYNVVLALRDSLHLLFKYMPLPFPPIPLSSSPSSISLMSNAVLIYRTDNQ